MTARGVAAIVGGGPAGLAAAATLARLGLRVRVLEQAGAVGERWRGHYDRLHLHTTRRMSGLPGLDIPAACGRWVSRDDFVRYQERYATYHGLAVEVGTRVDRVDRVSAPLRVAARPGEAGACERVSDAWRVTTSNGPIDAQYVVLATGFNNVPVVPAWPGRDRFGEIVHSQHYRNGARYAGKRVLVVGSGNSGAEIATDLAEHGAIVWWSFRTPPTIMPRELLGVAMQLVGIALRPLPTKVVDPMVAAFGRILVPDLHRFGLPRPTRGAYTGILRDHVQPIIDVGLVPAIQRGVVRPVPAIASLDAGSVEFVDGRNLGFDAIIACTGFRPSLEPLVGHLGVLDGDGIPVVHGPDEHPHAPNLFFVGYTNAVSGNLREINRHARQVAGAIEATL